MILHSRRLVAMDLPYDSSANQPFFRAIQISWLLLIFLEVALAFRFLLKLIGANPLAEFTASINGISMPFVLPFMAVFTSTKILGSDLEWTTLLAMAVYWFVLAGLIHFLVMSKTFSTPEAAARLIELEEPALP